VRVKLRGGLPQTASSVELAANGDVVVELFDFSDAAREALGNDVAFQVTVRGVDRHALLHALCLDGPLSDAELLETLHARFGSYHEVRSFLEARGVPFTSRFDPWA